MDTLVMVGVRNIRDMAVALRELMRWISKAEVADALLLGASSRLLPKLVLVEAVGCGRLLEAVQALCVHRGSMVVDRIICRIRDIDVIPVECLLISAIEAVINSILIMVKRSQMVAILGLIHVRKLVVHCQRQ
jgi:hypothetical protein